MIQAERGPSTPEWPAPRGEAAPVQTDATATLTEVPVDLPREGAQIRGRLFSVATPQLCVLIAAATGVAAGY